VLTVKIDKTKPTITPAVPTAANVFLLGQAASVAWTASDGGSGIDPALTASSPAALGAALDTGTPGSTTDSFGSKTLTVTATDLAGNVAAQTVTYAVSYASTGVQATVSGVTAPIAADGSSSFALGSVLPLSFNLTNSAGTVVSSAKPHLYLAQQQANGSWGTEMAAVAKPTVTGGNLAAYSASKKLYSFNLDTAALSAGTWRLHIDFGSGAALYATFGLK